MSFALGKNIIFIDSMLFMNSSLDKLASNLNDFKYLSSEFSDECKAFHEQLKLVKKKGLKSFKKQF